MSRILVIEDTPADMALLTYLLQAGGHTVTPARGGREGIDRALATTPDLILCDIRLPDMSGVDVLARLHRSEELKDTPVVAVTVMSSSGRKEAFLAAGFQGYLPKPIEPGKFLAEIAPYLNGDRPTAC